MDLENRAAINLDGFSVWLDVPFETVVARLPADGRRPLAADRGQMERLVRRPSDGLCPGTSAARSRNCARRRNRRADPRADSERLKGERALSGHLRHPRQPRGTRRGTCRHAAGQIRPRAGARRPGWLRCRSQPRHRSRARAQSPVGDPRQPRQGLLRPGRWQQLQSDRQVRRRLDRRGADGGQPSVPARPACWPRHHR